jgi:hypothetical protein
MKTYLAQRHRLDAIEAALAPSGTTIVITGGLPEDAPLPQAQSPADPQPEAPHPPRLAEFPADSEPSD